VVITAGIADPCEQWVLDKKDAENFERDITMQPHALF